LNDQSPLTGSLVRAHDLELSRLNVHHQAESHALSGTDPGPAGFDFVLPDDDPGSKLCEVLSAGFMSRKVLTKDGRAMTADALHFHRAVDDMEIWSASSDGFSFVITYESRAGPGFHGRPGYVASWRLLYFGSGAIKIGGSPFKTFAETEEACNVMLKHLTSES
jgi:hypothetical protein